jgi:hypothetical protein
MGRKMARERRVRVVGALVTARAAEVNELGRMMTRKNVGEDDFGGLIFHGEFCRGTKPNRRGYGNRFVKFHAGRTTEGNEPNSPAAKLRL